MPRVTRSMDDVARPRSTRAPTPPLYPGRGSGRSALGTRRASSSGTQMRLERTNRTLYDRSLLGSQSIEQLSHRRESFRPRDVEGAASSLGWPQLHDPVVGFVHGLLDETSLHERLDETGHRRGGDA